MFMVTSLFSLICLVGKFVSLSNADFDNFVLFVIAFTSTLIFFLSTLLGLIRISLFFLSS